jgi:tetratricopeptide (TPR) repeat protein
MIRQFIEQKGIRYAIAIGGASGYRTRGIPHAWLVSPRRTVVWHGHPASLRDAIIDEHIKSVRLRPEFKLPEALARYEKYLNAGDYGRGIKYLEKYLERPKDQDVAAAAKAAIEKATKYGEDKLATVAELVKDREYAYAMETLVLLDKMFKGTPTGDTVKEKLSALKKDKTAKLELTAQKYLDKAEAYIKNKKYKLAAKYLKAIIGSGKYGETKVAEKADKRLGAISRFL